MAKFLIARLEAKIASLRKRQIILKLVYVLPDEASVIIFKAYVPDLEQQDVCIEVESYQSLGRRLRHNPRHLQYAVIVFDTNRNLYSPALWTTLAMVGQSWADLRSQGAPFSSLFISFSAGRRVCGRDFIPTWPWALSNCA